MVSGAAVQKLMTKLSDEQEVLMNLADFVLIEGYVAESVLFCVSRNPIGIKGEKACEIQKEIAIIYLHYAIEKATSAGKQAISPFAEGG